MEKHSRIFVAGHRGLVGSAIVRLLKSKGHTHLILRTRDELNLLNQKSVEDFFRQEKPEFVFLAAAKVGGIIANQSFPADFLYENLVIATNVIHAAHTTETTKLLFLGSSCIYPKFAAQPLAESSLLSGPLEPTNEGYALAKIAGLKLCEMYQKQYGKRFISAMPSNLYGPNDNFHPEHSHVIPGMLRKFHNARIKNEPTVLVWGTGRVRREFLHVDDLAAAAYFLMLHYENPETINVGTGNDLTIAELAETIKIITKFQGKIEFDSSKPDGTPRKMLDISRISRLGWQPKRPLAEGIAETYRWACDKGIL